MTIRQVVLTPEPEGGYSVAVPSLPGCFTEDETYDEAIENAKEAIGVYSASLKARGKPVPDDSLFVKLDVVRVDA